MSRVLVVDDDGDVRDLVVRWLSARGHQVVAADSGPAALAAVDRRGMPEAAVIDVDMPGMDGVELLGRLRQRQPGLPAVFLTVLWSAPSVQRMREAGATYLPKPSSPSGLCAAVQRALAGTGDSASAAGTVS